MDARLRRSAGGPGKHSEESIHTRPPQPLARSEPAASHPALRAPSARRPAATSRLPGSACGRGRSLAPGLYPNAAGSKGRNHRRFPRRRHRLLRHPRHQRARPAHRQWLQLPLRQFHQACQNLQIKHRRTRPYTPRTNGKAERFIQTALREWAYSQHWSDSEQRDAYLQPWTDYYNRERPHGSLNYKPPISRSDSGTTS